MSTESPEPKGWASRGYLPHFDGGPVPQAITFRLAGSLPRARLDAWKEELALLPSGKAESVYRARVEAYLDAGHGPTWLRQPEIAALVQDTLLFGDGSRYELHAWVVMPNHVHVLATPREGYSLSELVEAWKSITSRRALRILGRKSPFWQPDYFDTFMRNEDHFCATVEYIERNPVHAGLCKAPEDWLFGSARCRRRSAEELT